mgnify:CR=1 FL=1
MVKEESESLVIYDVHWRHQEILEGLRFLFCRCMAIQFTHYHPRNFPYCDSLTYILVLIYFLYLIADREGNTR